MIEHGLHFGMRVFESKYATKKIQDWSACRSPSRARRRHAKGIKTRMIEKEVPTAFMVGNDMYGHPDVVSLIKAL